MKRQPSTTSLSAIGSVSFTTINKKMMKKNEERKIMDMFNMSNLFILNYI